MTALSEKGQAFLAILMSGKTSHPSFTGPALDAAQLSLTDIGPLFPVALSCVVNRASDVAVSAAEKVIQQVDILENPVFSVEDATASLMWIARSFEHDGDDMHPVGINQLLKLVVGCSSTLVSLPDTLTLYFDYLLTQAEKQEEVFQLDDEDIFLTAYCDALSAKKLMQITREQNEHMPVLLAEYEMMLTLDKRDAAVLMRIANESVMGAEQDAYVDVPGSYPLGRMPRYMAFAEATLQAAKQKVDRLHAGELPYAADKAFLPEEARVLGRCVRAALDQQAPWLDEVLVSLLPGVSLAPTAAKTVPSQSAVFAIARSIKDAPTGPSIEVLKTVLTTVRHAGVKKKLAKWLRTAQRRFSMRLDFILQLSADDKLSKSMLKTVSRAIEMLYRQQTSFSVIDWQHLFLTHKNVRAIVAKLIWLVEDSARGIFTAMPVIHGNQLSWQLVDRTEVAIELSQTVALWHPVDATAEERSAWRVFILEEEVGQPFLQAFRQFYIPTKDELVKDSTAMFAKHTVSAKSVIGVAGSEGWNLERNVGFSLMMTPWIFHFDFGTSFYPGYDALVETGPLRVYYSGASNGLESTTLREVPPILLSEALRSVDLLTSVSAAANMLECGDDSSESGSAEIRRAILKRVYAQNQEVYVGTRYVEVCGCKLHIATGRITRDGEPVSLTVDGGDAAPLVWLPHEDVLLSTLIESIHQLQLVR